MALALLVLTAVWSSAEVARAERVLLIGASGDADDVMLSEITVAMHRALDELSYEVVTESVALEVSEQVIPENANELRAVAEIHGATWTIVPIVHRVGSGGYWLTLRVGYAPETRVEEVDAEVRRSTEPRRLVALLRASMRVDGFGADVADVAGEDVEGRAADAAAGVPLDQDTESDTESDTATHERDAPEENDSPDAELDPADANEETDTTDTGDDEGSDLEEGDPSANSERPWMVSGGFGIHGLVRTPSTAGGGALGALELRAGRRIGPPGLELRAAFDVFFGAARGFAMAAGAAYVFKPFERPIYLGAAGAIGLFKATTGNDVVSFLLRVTPVVGYEIRDRFFVEVQPLSMTILSANQGVITLGLSARGGLRF